MKYFELLAEIDSMRSQILELLKNSEVFTDNPYETEHVGFDKAVIRTSFKIYLVFQNIGVHPHIF